MVRVVNLPAAGDKDGATGDSLEKASGSILPVTPEGQAIFGGSSTPTPAPHLISPAPPIALSQMISFEEKGVRLQITYIAKFG